MDPKVHPYQIVRTIAQSPSATLYEGRDAAGRPVALKVLPAHAKSEPTAMTRFKHEASTLAQLEHPHVVKVLDVQPAAETPFFVMELVGGESLDRRVARLGPLPTELVVGIADQVLQALDAAHARGIVHRDVKPANVMLASEQPLVAKVVDFGIALLHAEPGAAGPAAQPGTAAYMSPEQISGEGLDARSDLYSLACLLFELLSGQPPFASAQATHVLSAHVFREPPSLAELGVAGVPKALEGALRKALAKPRDARFSSAREFRSALLAAWANRGDRAEARDVGFNTAHAFIAVEFDAPPITLSTDAAPPPLSAALREVMATIGARETATGEAEGLVLVAGADAVELLSRCRALVPARRVVLCGPEDDLELMVAALQLGVFDYVPLPLDPADAGKRLARALRQRKAVS